MTRRTIVHMTTLVLLVSAGTLLALPADVPAVRGGASFELIPRELDGWRAVGMPPEDVLPSDPKVTDRLARTYQKDGRTIWLAADYWALQSEGNRLPVQDLLLPSKGWMGLETRDAEVPLAGGRRLTANLILMRTPIRHMAILYWYQLGTTSVASDHAHRALAVYRRLAERRADAALVRVATPIGGAVDEAAALATLTGFVPVLYPELVTSVPSHRSQEER